MIRGSAILKVAKLERKGFRNPFRGPFFFAVYVCLAMRKRLAFFTTFQLLDRSSSLPVENSA